MSKIGDFLNNEVNPILDAAKSGLLVDLSPKKRGGSYELTCPTCKKPKKAFYYPFSSQFITCNRQNECGTSTSLWDYLLGNCFNDKTQVVKALCDAAGVKPPENDYKKQETDIAILKKILKYNLTHSSIAFDYMNKERGWSPQEIADSDIGYFKNYDTLIKTFEKFGGDLSVLEKWRLYHPDRNVVKNLDVLPFEERIVGLWEQPDGSFSFWGRYIGVPPEGVKKYKFQTGTKKTLPYQFNHFSNRKRGYAITVEGNMDCERLLANKIPAFALGGNSISSEQVLTISKSYNKIINWIDDDNAGHKGAMLTIKKLNQVGVESEIFFSKNNIKDADQAIGELGDEQVKTCISNDALNSGVYIAQRIALMLDKDDGFENYETARNFISSLNGFTKYQAINALNDFGIELESYEVKALKMLALYISAGLEMETAQSQVEKNTGIKITLEVS